MDQLILTPDLARGLLRGQITLDPHRTRKNDGESAAQIEGRVLAMLAESVKIELDGKPCKVGYEVRELWLPPAATVGDIVMVQCALPRATRELRVFAGTALNALVVSVEGADASGAPASRSVMIPGGSFTPPYRFGQAKDWRAGGANQFLPDGGLATHDPTPPPGAADTAQRVSPAPTPSIPPGSTGGFVEVSVGAQAWRYLLLGFVHILPLGWDHVLFVAGLVLGSGLKLRGLVLQLSAFTLAHTVTLALGALGWIVLPGGVVEPLIAFSIAYVAIENLLRERESRYRLLVVLAFGLLHGQGFAGALTEAGLPQESFLLALLSFNLGVELGQLTVVALLLAPLKLIRTPHSLRRYAVVPGSIAIGLAGLYWGVERLLG